MSTNISSGPCDQAVVVTPTDGLTISRPRYLFVGVAGDIACTMGGNPVVFKSVAAGFVPICPTIIAATGTTATNILALY